VYKSCQHISSTDPAILSTLTLVQFKKPAMPWETLYYKPVFRLLAFQSPKSVLPTMYQADLFFTFLRAKK
jgi:hypothetical protein